MKELIINQNDDKITLVDKNDILDALSEKTNKENIAQVINDDSNLGNGAFIHTDNSDEYSINISSDKDIIQTGDTCNISATVKKGTTPVTNKNVKFSDGTNTIYKKTNSSGVATYTYTGTGKGVTDIKAKYSNLLQETYELYDCKFYDLGTSSEKDTLWYITNGTFNRTSEYTEIVEADTGTCYMRWNGSTINVENDGGVIEFDLQQVDGQRNYNNFYIRDNGGYNTRGSSSLSLYTGKNVGDWVHYRVEFRNTDKFYIYADDSTTPVERPLSSVDTYYKLMFACDSNTTKLRFKNLKVYPI